MIAMRSIHISITYLFTENSIINHNISLLFTQFINLSKCTYIFSILMLCKQQLQLMSNQIIPQIIWIVCVIWQQRLQRLR